MATDGKKTGPGRPQGKSPTLKTVRLTREDFIYVQSMAEQTASSVNAVARGLIRAAILHRLMDRVSQAAHDETRNPERLASIAEDAADDDED